MSSISSPRDDRQNSASVSPPPTDFSDINGRESTTSTNKSTKLRLSCDACAASKVKCNREHPRCGRCVAANTDCFYGPSRKLGKIRRKQHQQSTLQNSSELIPFPTISKSTISAAAASPSLQQGYYDSLHFPFADTMDLDGGRMELSGVLTDSSFMDENIFSPSVSSTARRSESYQRGNFNLNSFRPSYYPPAGVTDFQSYFPTPEQSYSSIPSSSPSTTSSITAPQSFPLSPSSIEGAAQIHCCYTTAYNTLERLHLRSQIQQHAPPIQTLDTVLRNNKHALSSLLQLLACPCAVDPHLALLYASITSKIMMWYRVAGGINPTSPTNEVVESLATAVSGSCSSGTTNTTNNKGSSCDSSNCNSTVEGKRAPFNGRVAPMPITIGEFSLDEEDQKELRRQLLLSELRKVGNLVDAVIARKGDNDDGDRFARADDLYLMLGSWLKDELARTVRAVSLAGN